MATYFSPVSLLTRDIARTEQRFTNPVDAPFESGPQDEWRLLNEINLAWFAKMLSAAMQKPIEDEAWFNRAIRFSEYLRCVLDMTCLDDFQALDFTRNEPF